MTDDGNLAVVDVQQVAPHSYKVDVAGREVRRNRKFLRTTQEQQPEDSGPVTTHPTEPDAPDEPPARDSEAPVLVVPATNSVHELAVPETERRTRTRVVKWPNRFDDYI